MTDLDMQFNGARASDIGAVVLEMPRRGRARERVESVTIPGRSGVMHMRHGTDVYDPLLLTATIYCETRAIAQAAGEWLRGQGTLIFGDDEQYAYSAYVIEEMVFDPLIEGDEKCTGVVSFECEPYRYQSAPDPDITVTASGALITGKGNTFSLPAILISGAGDGVLMIGQNTLTVDLSGGDVLIDSHDRECYNGDRTALRNSAISGDFPTLAKDATGVSWTGGITRVVITPRWRWLS